MSLFKNKTRIVLVMILTALVSVFLLSYYDDLVSYLSPKEVIVTSESTHDSKDTSLQIPVPAVEPEIIEVKNEEKQNVIKKQSAKQNNISKIINAKNIPSNVLNLALTAYQNAAQKKLVTNPKLTIIDYSLPSNHKRMWIVDMNKKKVDLNTYVSHGVGSGDKKTARNFSNQPNSRKSSIGVMKTGGIYHGHNGTSLYLHGLERNINDNVYKRHIVMHGANYVNEQIAKNAGSVGRSFGCPAIDYRLAKTVINKISNGSIVFIYYPNKSWLKGSVFL